MAHATISEDLRDVEKMDRHETAIEATYRVSIFPFLSVQPGLQVVFNPGADSDLENAIVVIYVVTISFINPRLLKCSSRNRIFFLTHLNHIRCAAQLVSRDR